jgi:uncharacterized repeat protein (TIGR03806 family)
MTRTVSLIVWVLVWGLAGCGGGGGSSGGTITPPPPPPAPTGGLDQRPANASCVAPAISTGTASVSLTDAYPSLPAFNNPLKALQSPGDNSRWYVLEQAGRVHAFANNPAANSIELVLDIDAQVAFSGGNDERGLLGMAFHPQFASNGFIYLYYIDNGSDSVISRWTSNDNGQTIAPGSEFVIIRINQDAGNHNGGEIAFGSDGYLYIGLGDGGGSGDPRDRGQDTTNLLGAMLRLDVDGASPYGIPANNPFVGNALCPADHSSTTDCPEIYAFGFRNPYRWSFDSATGELWLGDVGQNAWEEVDRVDRGGNYGWDCREGAHDFEPAGCPANLIDPVAEYGRSEGFSVTGGVVYRGSAIPALVGNYVFGDFGTGTVWNLTGNGQGGFDRNLLLNSGFNIAAFAEDSTTREVYLLHRSDTDGRLYLFEDAGGGGGGASPLPALLSNLGCFDANDPSQPVTGLVPYQPNASFWSDGADKERWLAIPDGQTITIGADNDFEFPNGTVLAKHFRVQGQLIETRLFMRHPNGTWAGYTYEWDAQGADATQVLGGKVVDIGGQDWIYPSGAQCLNCHTAAAGRSLGLEVAQLNSDLTYAATGRTSNQLTTLDDIMMFSAPLSGAPSTLDALADPSDAGAALEDRARAYLHTNCSGCHRPGGAAQGTLDFRFNTALSATGGCDISPVNGDLGVANARVIAPGDADLSVLWLRMGVRDANAMPPLASNLVDSAGRTVIRDWIEGLSSCN